MKTKTLLILSILTCQLISAQAPGGVATNLTMWVRSNSGTSTTGSLLDSWTYVNDGTKSFTSTLTDRPTLSPSIINFFPAVRLTAAQIMFGPTGVNAPIAAGDDDYTVFAVWQSNTVSNFQRVWSQFNTGSGGADGASLATWNDGNYGDEVEVAPFNHTTNRPYTAGVWNISQLNLLNQALNDLEIVDDRNISVAPLVDNTDNSATNGAALRLIGTNFNTIGSKSFAGEQALNGDIAELIIFDRPISGAERARVFSYLAMKYGITIKTDVIKSDGVTKVWNAATNSTYNNNVFGLVRDDVSGLTVSQSNSMANGSGNGTGQSGKANIVLSTPSSLSNQDFLLIGNDNGSLTEVTTNVPVAAAGSKRLGRQWRAQHTGDVGTINMSIDLNGLTVTGTNPINFRLMIDADGDGNFTTGTIRYTTPSSYTGGVLSFNGLGLRFNNNEVFALITSAAGGTPLPVTWKSFTGKVVSNSAQLNWEVSNNESAKEYQVEHSLDGANFTQVGIVANQRNVTKYSFTYPSLNGGNHYFRIRQVDLDGRVTYSKIVSVKGPDITIQLINNPVKSSYAELEIHSIRNVSATIELRSVSGATVINRNTVVLNPGMNRIRIPMDKATGVYLLQLKTGDIILNERILKL